VSDFSLPVRVYYEDTDSGGVVYYANYLKFMERARTEYLRSFGFEQDALAEQENVLFAVHRSEADYLKPARFNDLLTVTADIAEQKRASLTFRQEVLRENGDICCRGLIKVVCVSRDSFRPTPIPETILRVLNEQ
jgi:acyl-CoA thioester hydrolase